MKRMMQEAGEKSMAGSQKRKPRARNAPPSATTREIGARVEKNSEVVYRDLKRAIVGMDLTPGTPIVEKELTEKYSVSRTPIREAVLRLAEERLVDVVPKSGTFVARIPLSVLREALVARRALEEVTVRAATQRATQSQIMHLRALIQRQRELASSNDNASFHKEDEAFHAAIAEAGGYPGIWDMIQNIRVQAERYRRLTLPQEGRTTMIVSEHAAVVDAIAARDADAAVAAMTEHLNKLRLDISVFRDLWPDYFIYDSGFDDSDLTDNLES